LEVLLLQQELTTKMSNEKETKIEKVQPVASSKPTPIPETKPIVATVVETKKPVQSVEIKNPAPVEIKKTVEVKKSNTFDFGSNNDLFTSNSFSGKAASLDDFMSGGEDTGLGHIVDQLDKREKEKKSLDFLDKVLHIENKPEEMIKFGDEKKGSILGLFDSKEVEVKETPKANSNLGGGLDDFF
jgi:hypothetical protein